MSPIRTRARGAAIEIAIVLALSASLAGVSVGLLALQYGEVLRFGTADAFTIGAAGLAAGTVVRVTVRLHRRWKMEIGRFTAAAALCALAAVVGAAVVMIPGECPGGLFSTGRCGVKEAAAWGQVAGLAAIVNFGLAGLVLALLRFVRSLPRAVRDVAGDGTAQGLDWIRAIRATGPSGWWASARRRRSRDQGSKGRPRHPGEPKGRPTPRRAEAERARRKRLRAGT
jgi:hypothetical protein